MSAGNFARLIGWLKALKGPGVLVMSQPILMPRVNQLDSNKERTLVDFEQYVPLVKAMAKCGHDVVLLCGDVHWGRVARAPIGDTGHYLYEIVSSPLSLISAADWGISTALATGLTQQGASPNPVVFPHGNVAGVPAKEVEYLRAIPARGQSGDEEAVDWTDPEILDSLMALLIALTSGDAEQAGQILERITAPPRARCAENFVTIEFSDAGDGVSQAGRGESEVLMKVRGWLPRRNPDSHNVTTGFEPYVATLA